jgi:hypothetical protein
LSKQRTSDRRSIPFAKPCGSPMAAACASVVWNDASVAPCGRRTLYATISSTSYRRTRACDRGENTEPRTQRRTTMTEHISTSDYFGGCPWCGQTDGYRNVGRDHWFFCRTHKTKWWVGSNLFSGWRDETEQEQRNARRLLSEFTEVEPIIRKKPVSKLQAWQEVARMQARISPPQFALSTPFTGYGLAAEGYAEDAAKQLAAGDISALTPVERAAMTDAALGAANAWREVVEQLERRLISEDISKRSNRGEQACGPVPTRSNSA